MRLKSPDQLRAKMIKADLSFRDLAKAAECSTGFISHLTAGRRATCTSALAGRISEALGVTTGSLFAADSATSGCETRKPQMRAGAAA